VGAAAGAAAAIMGPPSRAGPLGTVMACVLTRPELLTTAEIALLLGWRSRGGGICRDPFDSEVINATQSGEFEFVMACHALEEFPTPSTLPSHVSIIPQDRPVIDCMTIRTFSWMHDCVAADRILSLGLRPLIYTPPPTAEGIPELRKMKASIAATGFRDAERFDVIRLVKLSGAEYTGFLTQRHSHLICGDRSSSKYQQAIKWGVKVVSLKWLQMCVSQWTHAQESDFPV